MYSALVIRVDCPALKKSHLFVSQVVVRVKPVDDDAGDEIFLAAALILAHLAYPYGKHQHHASAAFHAA